VDGVIPDLYERFDVCRLYCDPQHIDHLLDLWLSRLGEKKVFRWFTNRPRPVAWAVRSYSSAIAAGDLSHPATSSSRGT
jgi:hypothetical protein